MAQKTLLFILLFASLQLIPGQVRAQGEYDRLRQLYRLGSSLSSPFMPLRIATMALQMHPVRMYSSLTGSQLQNYASQMALKYNSINAIAAAGLSAGSRVAASVPAYILNDNGSFKRLNNLYQKVILPGCTTARPAVNFLSFSANQVFNPQSSLRRFISSADCRPRY